MERGRTARFIGRGASTETAGMAVGSSMEDDALAVSTPARLDRASLPLETTNEGTARYAKPATIKKAESQREGMRLGCACVLVLRTRTPSRLLRIASSRIRSLVCCASSVNK